MVSPRMTWGAASTVVVSLAETVAMGTMLPPPLSYSPSKVTCTSRSVPWGSACFAATAVTRSCPEVPPVALLNVHVQVVWKGSWSSIRQPPWMPAGIESSAATRPTGRSATISPVARLPPAMV